MNLEDFNPRRAGCSVILCRDNMPEELTDKLIGGVEHSFCKAHTAELEQLSKEDSSLAKLMVPVRRPTQRQFRSAEPREFRR